ncbi:hypothetical protein [Allocoleopsis franciscana]|uniref:hypothetical protein n=1 Tax=Allocoleopsis franciscana TaxID=2886352 RepID=UPI00031B5130|nr:hypothetical protein [Allocoleopsis franciscana]
MLYLIFILEQLQELCGYLKKHQARLINYGQRREIGKPIRSSRMEKGVDQVIGKRQKQRGKS